MSYYNYVAMILNQRMSGRDVVVVKKHFCDQLSGYINSVALSNFPIFHRSTGVLFQHKSTSVHLLQIEPCLS